LINKLYKHSIVFIIFILVFIGILQYQIMEPGYVFIALLEIILFFSGSQYCIRYWKSYTPEKFEKNIFWTSFVLRSISAMLLYWWFKEYTQTPFGPGNWDEYKYHEAAIDVSDAFKQGNWNLQESMPFKDISDFGYPTILGFIYYIFGSSSVFVPRLWNILLSSFTAILIYRLFSRTFQQEFTARLSAIFFVFMPNFIYYTGVHLKESTMVFLVVFFFERFDALIRSNSFKIIPLTILALNLFAFFFFRTVLGLAVIFSVGTYIIFSSAAKKNYVRILSISWLVIGFSFLLTTSVMEEVQDIYDNSGTQQLESMEYRTTQGNELAKYGKASIFAPFMFAVPFATFVNVEGQEIIKLLSGGYLIKNILSLFILFTLFYLIKERLWRKFLLPLSFVVVYTTILTMSSFALSERFHLNILPFWLAFAAYGIVNKTYRTSLWYAFYFILLFVVVLGWNWFKLAGRGLV